MKLLFVTHWANNMLIFRTWMLEEAVRRGHEVLVLCPPDAEAAHFADLGVRHIPWVLRRGGGAANLLSAIGEVRRVIQNEKPDSTVVYCVQPIMAMLCAWKLGGRSGKLYPTFTGLGSLWTDLVLPTGKKRLVRWGVERVFGALLPQAQAVFVLNRDDKAQVAAWNKRRLLPLPGVLGQDDFHYEAMAAGAKRVPVIQTLGEGVDLEYFCLPRPEERISARARWGIAMDARVVGFVGRLIREKGAQDFLALCREMQNDTNVHFLVVGDPDRGNPSSLSEAEMRELEAVPRLHREPWMQDVRPAYAAMDVLVFLSRYREGLPVTPQEAMACGVPVVAYDNVGSREVVQEALIVQKNDIEGTVDKVHEIFAEPRRYEHATISSVQGLNKRVVLDFMLRELVRERTT